MTGKRSQGVSRQGVSRQGVSRRGVSRRALMIGAPTLAVGLAGLLTPRLARAAPQALSLRLGDHGQSTRFVLELSDPVTWRTFPLAGPERLVVDVPTLTYDGLPLPEQTGHVKTIRHGRLNDGTTRLVLDLTGPALVDKDFLLEPDEGHGWRLVIDMVPVTEAVFLASVGQVLAPVTPASLTPEPSTRLATVEGRGGFHRDPTPEPLPRPAPAPMPAADAAGPDGAGMAASDPEALTPASLTAPARPAAPSVWGTDSPAVDPAGLDGGSTAGSVPTPPPGWGSDPGYQAPPGMPVIAREGATMVRLADGRRVPVPMTKPPPPALAVVADERRPVVVLDPGHGGRDPGATGLSGVHEKVLTLAMARELKRKLEATGRYRVVLTRNRDTAIRLRDRVALGRQAGGDLFISIHADALGDHGVRGLSVYTLSETASDAEAAALAERENKVDVLLGIDLSHESPDVATILIDLAQRDTKNSSVLFANTLIKNLPADIPKLSSPHRSAGFAVLKAPDVPSVLVEMGFLSNRTDEKLLRTQAYRAKLADAVLASIDDFLAVQQQRARRL